MAEQVRESNVPAPQWVKTPKGGRVLQYAPEPAGPAGAPGGAMADTAAAPSPRLLRFGISFINMEASLAAKLKLASIFSVSGAANVSTKALLLDALATTGYYAEQTIDGTVISGFRRGLGVRIALRVQSVDAELSLTFAAVAASAALKRADVNYEVVNIALPEEIVDDLFIGAPLSGPLNELNYGLLQRAVNVKFPKYLAEARKAGTPLGLARFPVGPVAALTTDPIFRSRSVNYAMMRIGAGFSLKGALEAAGDRFDRDIILLIYAQVAGLRDPTAHEFPSGPVVKRANLWLSE
jgi:hypothetical protein